MEENKMSNIKIRNYIDKMDFCRLSTFTGVVLGLYMFLLGALLNFLPEIIGLSTYLIIGIAIMAIVVMPNLRKHDDMECHKKAPAGFSLGFVVFLCISLYALNALGWI